MTKVLPWVKANPVMTATLVLALLLIIYLLRGCNSKPVVVPSVVAPVVDTTAVKVWKDIAAKAQNERDSVQRKLAESNKQVATSASQAKYWAGKYKEARAIADHPAQLVSCDSLVAVIDDQGGVIHEQQSDMNNLVEAWGKEVAAKDSVIASQGRVMSDLRIALGQMTDDRNLQVARLNTQIKKTNRERNFGKLGTIGGVCVGAAAALLIKK